MRIRLRKRAVLAALVAAAGLLVPAGGAQAATAPIELRCVTTAFGVDHEAAAEEYKLKVSAPSSMENGSTVVLGLGLPRLPVAPVAVDDVSVVTTVRLRLILPGLPDEVITQEGDVSETVDLEAGDRLPGQPSFQWSRAVTALEDGDVLEIHLEDVTVVYETGDLGMEGAEVACTPTDGTLLDSVTVLGDPPACDPDPCGGAQTFVGEPPADALSVDVDPEGAGSTFSLPALEASVEPQETGVEEVTFARVSDLRSDPLGWSLTAELDGPLETAGLTSLPESALAVVDVDCGQTPGASGSAPAVPGEDGTLDEPVTLCSVSPGSLGSTGAPGGQWDVTGSLTLTVPPFAGSGTYYGTIVLTLA